MATQLSVRERRKIQNPREPFYVFRRFRGLGKLTYRGQGTSSG